jgi:hypothetical protein
MNDTRQDPRGSVTILVAIEVPALGPAHPDMNKAWTQGVVSGVLSRGLLDDLITSWWIAEDERYDGSDNDSAVFVPMGQQTYWATKVRFEAEHPPCTNCLRAEQMDQIRCPNIKSECLDCCGCPDHSSDQ